MRADAACWRVWLLPLLAGCDFLGPVDSVAVSKDGTEAGTEGGGGVPAPTEEQCSPEEGPQACLYVYSLPPERIDEIPVWPVEQSIIYPHFCRGESAPVVVYVNVLGSVTDNRFALFGGRGLRARVEDAAKRWLAMDDGLRFDVSVSTTWAPERAADTRDAASDVVGDGAAPPEAPYATGSAECTPRFGEPCHALECTITIFTSNDAGPLQYTTHRSSIPSDTISLEALVEHEFGHVLGLADTNLYPGYAMGLWPGPGDVPENPHRDEYVAAWYIYGPR